MKVGEMRMLRWTSGNILRACVVRKKVKENGEFVGPFVRISLLSFFSFVWLLKDSKQKIFLLF